jgi:hypothetical protein
MHFIKYGLYLGSIIFFGSLKAEIILDGKIDEPEWQQAKNYTSFVVTSPDTGKTPKVKTTVKLLSQPEGLYISFANQQERQNRSRKYSAKDQHTSADFNVVSIDFSGQGDSVFEFVTTLGNGSMDGVYSRGNQFDSDWEGAWDFKTHEEDDYWYSEIFVPWSIAPFPKSVDENSSNISVHFSRYNIAEAEQYSFPDTSSSRQDFMQSLHLVNVNKPDESTLTIFPYMSATRDIKQGESVYKVGADLLWKPSVNQQITVAINPDFGQAESDELIANFSAIETLHSDKRAFFTENQNLFVIKDTTFELLNTRRMGGSSDTIEGNPTDITAAIKYLNTGKNIDLGLIVVSEDDRNNVLGKTFISSRWLLKNEHGYLGQMINWVDRANIERSAMTSAIDFGYWQNKIQLDGKVLFSQTKQATTSSGLGGTLNIKYRANRQWNTELAMAWLDKDLELNDMGYLARNNLKKIDLTTNYLYIPKDDNHFFRQYDLRFDTTYESNFDNERLPINYALSLTTKTSNNAKLIADVKYESSGYDDLITRGHGSIFLPDKQSYLIKYVSPYGGQLSFSADVNRFQEGINGWANSFSVSSDFALTDKTIISTGLFHLRSDDWLIGNNQGELMRYQRTFDQVSINLLWAMSEDQEFSFKGQWYVVDAIEGEYFSTHGQAHMGNEQPSNFKQSQLSLQLRYRYRFAPLSDIYLVYARNGHFYDEGKAIDNNNEIISQQFDEPEDNLFMFKVRVMY